MFLKCSYFHAHNVYVKNSDPGGGGERGSLRRPILIFGADFEKFGSTWSQNGKILSNMIVTLMWR